MIPRRFCTLLCLSSLGILLYSSCHEKADKQATVQPTSFTTKIIKAVDESPFNAADYVRNIHLVPLEASEASLFSQIDKLKIKNNYIYILDLTGLHYVYMFDMQGKFIRRIGTRGLGPNEYWRLGDFDVDKTGNTYLYDRQKKRMFKYDPNGKLISCVSTTFRAEAFNLLNNNQFIFSLTKEPDTNGKEGTRLIVTDSSYQIQKSYLHYADDFQDAKLTTGLFTESTQGILYTKPVNDSLYLLDYDGNIKQAYYIDFGPHAVPKDLKMDYARLVEARPKNTYNYMYIMPFLVGNNMVGNLYEGNVKAIFFYDADKDKFNSRTLTATTISHKNINLPMGIMGDSVVVSYIDYSLLGVDQDKDKLDPAIVNHIRQKNEGMVLAFYRIK